MHFLCGFDKIIKREFEIRHFVALWVMTDSVVLLKT